MTTVIAYIDGGCRGNPGPSGAGMLLETPDGRLIETRFAPIGIATNNVAEYEALILALQRARAIGARRVHVRSDSELLVRQMRGQYRVKHPALIPRHAHARALMAQFDQVTFEAIPRAQNREADRLATMAVRESARHGGASLCPETWTSPCLTPSLPF